MDMNKVDARPFDRLWPARHEGWKTVDRQAVLVLFDALVSVARHANLEAFQDLSGAEACCTEETRVRQQFLRMLLGQKFWIPC